MADSKPNFDVIRVADYKNSINYRFSICYRISKNSKSKKSWIECLGARTLHDLRIKNFENKVAFAWAILYNIISNPLISFCWLITKCWLKVEMTEAERVSNCCYFGVATLQTRKLDNFDVADYEVLVERCNVNKVFTRLLFKVGYWQFIGKIILNYLLKFKSVNPKWRRTVFVIF